MLCDKSQGSDRSTADLPLPSIFDRSPGARNPHLLFAARQYMFHDDCQMRLSKWATTAWKGI